MARVSRFKKRESDRSGFDGLEIAMLKDGNLKVQAIEYDIPPPSKKSLGGEGDIALGEYRANASFTLASTETTAAQALQIQVLAAGTQISPPPRLPPLQGAWLKTVLVSGSLQAVNLTSNPQVVAGQEGDIMAVQCVDSGVTLENGAGLALANSRAFVMDSGSVITLIYNTGSTVWWETSRNRVYF